MKIFNAGHKVTTIIHTNYYLLPVLNRFGIRLGVKDRSLEDICREKDIDPRFVLAIINTYCNEDYFPEQELMTFSPLLLVEYLKKTHNHYLNFVVPNLEDQLQQMVLSCKGECSGLKMLEAFYRKYKDELLIHIREEEEKVFPYVTHLIKNKEKIPADYNISNYEREHSDIDTKLNDLMNLVIKYLEPAYDDNLCNEFLISLVRFEKDLKDHSRIEDKILVPHVIGIEKQMAP